MNKERGYQEGLYDKLNYEQLRGADYVCQILLTSPLFQKRHVELIEGQMQEIADAMKRATV